MAEQKHRPLSSNEREIELLKSNFASNETDNFSTLKAVRAVFLGFPITASEIAVVRSIFKDPDIRLAFRKKMYPMLTPQVEIGEESEFWFGTETEILDKMPETVKQVIESKQKCLDMLDRAFRLLDGSEEGSVDVSYTPDMGKDPMGVELLARNKYVKTIVTGLTIIKVIAGQKSETVEKAKERLLKDSTK